MKKPIILSLICVLAITAKVFASPAPVFQMRLVLDNPSADSRPMSYIIRNEDRSYTNVVNVQKTVLLDQTALESAIARTNSFGVPTILITFTKSGAKQFAEVTKQNIHKRLAIIIAGRVCEVPIIETQIPGGKVQISGEFTQQAAEDLAKKINDAVTKK